MIYKIIASLIKLLICRTPTKNWVAHIAAYPFRCSKKEKKNKKKTLSARWVRPFG